MYVCIYVMYVRVYVRVRVYACACAYACACVSVFVRACLCVCMTGKSSIERAVANTMRNARTLLMNMGFTEDEAITILSATGDFGITQVTHTHAHTLVNTHTHTQSLL